MSNPLRTRLCADRPGHRPTQRPLREGGRQQPQPDRALSPHRRQPRDRLAGYQMPLPLHHRRRYILLQRRKNRRCSRCWKIDSILQVDKNAVFYRPLSLINDTPLTASSFRLNAENKTQNRACNLVMAAACPLIAVSTTKKAAFVEVSIGGG